MPHVRFIQQLSVGYDNLDVAAIQADRYSRREQSCKLHQGERRQENHVEFFWPSSTASLST